MNFGLTVSTNEPRDADPFARVAGTVERATCARDNGFDMIAVGNRYSFGPAVNDERGEVLETWRFQPFPLLAHIAGHLGATVKYATAVLVSTGLHPVQLAEDIATLDVLCGGGFHVGIGLGWLPYELEAFGLERKGGVRRFEELVTITRALLTEESVTFDGRYFQVHEASLVARAAQRPCPPIWIGASADPAVRRAARLGDTWSISGHTPVRELVRQEALFREELAKVGRPLPVERPINRVVYIAEDRETAFAQALPHFTEQYRKRSSVGWFQPLDAMKQALEDGEMHWIVGDPDDCHQQLRYLEEQMGITRAIFTMPIKTTREQWLNTIRLLGKEVLPRFDE